MKVALIGCQELFCKELGRMIQENFRHKEFYFFENACCFLKYIKKKEINILMIEVNLNNFKAGLSLAKHFKLKFSDTKIVFLSEYMLFEWGRKIFNMGFYLINKTENRIEILSQLNKISNGEVFNNYNLEMINTLTMKEEEVLRLLAKGMKQATIGDILGISTRTVNNHLSNIYEKLDVNSNVAAIVKSIEWGIISLNYSNMTLIKKNG